MPKRSQNINKSIEDALKQSTMTDLVREAAQSLGDFSVDDIDGELVKRHGIVPSKFIPKIEKAVFELCRWNEAKALEPGRYRYVGKGDRRCKIDIIWHLVRSGRNVSTAELVRLSGAKRSTITEYLCYLTGAGYVRRVKPGHYQLVNDPGPKTPIDESKKQRLKRIRKDGCKIIALPSRRIPDHNRRGHIKAEPLNPGDSQGQNEPISNLGKIAEELFKAGLDYPHVAEIMDSIRKRGIERVIKDPLFNLSKHVVLWIDVDQIIKEFGMDPKIANESGKNDG